MLYACFIHKASNGFYELSAKVITNYIQLLCQTNWK